jgi:hypothetical protein
MKTKDSVHAAMIIASETQDHQKVHLHLASSTVKLVTPSRVTHGQTAMDVLSG